jgi:Mg2+/Co2+ transporter CorB
VNELPASVLLLALLALIVLSAFFSSSETGMMALNRYRLRHLANQGQRPAQRVAALLERPDRLIGVILLGNNFVNILASALATILALRVFGEAGIAIATLALTVVILIFAEVTPKTLAALHPERIAFPASVVLVPLLKVLYPVVWVINLVANGLLRLARVSPEVIDAHPLSREELRTVVNEADAMIPQRHKRMLLSILDLEEVSVNDIMVPRNEIVGIDLEEDEDTMRELIVHSQHTRLPVYRGDINDAVGVIHLRRALRLVQHDRFSREALEALVQPPYFVPSGTPLHTQLIQFQRQHRRIGLVVDEYGDIEGLVTLEDILEEIVGEFTTDPADRIPDVVAEADGTYLVDGSAFIRDLNRGMGWELPTDGPKTLNGLILEHMESIPEPGTSMRLAGYPLEIVAVKEHVVRTVRINPGLRSATRETTGE